MFIKIEKLYFEIFGLPDEELLLVAFGLFIPDREEKDENLFVCQHSSQALRWQIVISFFFLIL